MSDPSTQASRASEGIGWGENKYEISTNTMFVRNTMCCVVLADTSRTGGVRHGHTEI